jgi:hypothetical protein
MLYEVPELITFINKSINKKKWTYCERYMKINGEKLEERLPLDKKIPGKSNAYVNGIVIKKESDYIYFITYTLCGGVCVFNHESKHGPNGELLTLSMNAFDSGIINGVDEDGKQYVLEYVNTCLKNLKNNSFEWDIIE